MLLEYRINYESLWDEQKWENLLAYLMRHRRGVDSLALVDGNPEGSEHYPYTSQNGIQSVADKYKLRMEELREKGFGKVGIINIATLGHLDEGHTAQTPPLPTMVGFDGRVSTGCLCPNDPACHAHFAMEYSAYAKAGPDFLWIDDDVKIHTNGVNFGCFCPNCIALFNKNYDHQYAGRETLTAALENPGEAQLRVEWVDFISGSLAGITKTIGDAVHAVNPKIKMGFMCMRQSRSTYNGADFPRWFEAGGIVRARPGEGTYDDSVPSKLYVKALDTAQQHEAFPDTVEDSIYEVENYPYFRYQKSVRFLMSELTIAAAQGMNGSLVNLLPYTPLSMEPLAKNPRRFFAEDWMQGICAQRAQWDVLTDFTAGLHGDGFWPAISSRYDAIRPLKRGDSFFRYTDDRKKTFQFDRRNDEDDGFAQANVTATYTLCVSGLPLTADRRHAKGVVLMGDMVNGFTNEEIVEFMKKGVMLDGGALTELENRGLNGYTGVRVAEVINDDTQEVFNLGDPVNEGVMEYANGIRNIHFSFWGGAATALEPVREGVRIVSDCYDYGRKKRGASCTLYENGLGGRVCVIGNGAFDRLDGADRHLQLRRIADWLTRDQLAVTREEQGRVANFVRCDENHISVAYANMSLDDQPPLKVTLRGAKSVRQIMEDGSANPLTVSGEGEVVLPVMRAYETIVVLADK